MSENALGKADGSTASNGKEFSCANCGKQYASRQGLSYHYQNTDCDGYVCSVCGRSGITTERGLTRHKANEHGSEGSYIDSRLADKGWFYQKYVVGGCSTSDISELVGCSRPQASAWKRKHDIDSVGSYKSRGEGEENPTWVDNTITIICDYCGEETERIESNVNTENVFCSWDCINNWKSENWVGEDNPLYEGGPQNYGSGWNSARQEALDRDNHTCQDCGATENLHVHHIQRVRDFENPEDAHFLENLITLCRLCHQKWEGIPLKPDNR
jgi:5-methylcytosine-specific restriction endonuclease McrA